MVFPEPATTFAIEPKTRGDDDKISTALQRLLEEDPVLRVSRDAQTHEMLISGAGQLHVEVVVARLRKRYKVEVNLKKPKIPYRETIKGSCEAHGRHKKQTGGHGQFGDCRIRMKPLPRGEDFKFVDDIFGGSIPKNFIPAVEKGIQEARIKGFLAGYPMVDFQVELYDGQYHDVDSSEMSFKIAGSLAFKDGVAKCRPTLLEPIMKVEIAVPDDYAGAVMGDLSSRRGRPQGMEPKGSLQVIKAEVPLAEMLSYDAELTSMTGGRGSYHMEMDHYDEVPGAPPGEDHRGLQGRAAASRRKRSSTRTPAPSTPNSHGRPGECDRLFLMKPARAVVLSLLAGVLAGRLRCSRRSSPWWWEARACPSPRRRRTCSPSTRPRRSRGCPRDRDPGPA